MKAHSIRPLGTPAGLLHSGKPGHGILIDSYYTYYTYYTYYYYTYYYYAYYYYWPLDPDRLLWPC